MNTRILLSLAWMPAAALAQIQILPPPSPGTFPSLEVTGDTILGDEPADSVTVNAGTFVAPNATGTSSTAISNNSSLDARYGLSAYSIVSGSTPASTTPMWERTVTSLSGSGTTATLVLATPVSPNPTGKLIAIWNCNPSSWNGLYVVNAFNGTNTLTLDTPKTATYVSGARAALTKPIAKFSANAVGRWLGTVQYAAYDPVTNNSGEWFGRVNATFTTSGTFSHSYAQSPIITDPLTNQDTGIHMMACAPVGNTAYLVVFRGYYNGNSGYYYNSGTFRLLGTKQGGVTVTAPTSDYTP